jgi:hypothetical protein
MLYASFELDRLVFCAGRRISTSERVDVLTAFTLKRFW